MDTFKKTGSAEQVVGYAVHRGGDRYLGLFDTEEDARLTARYYNNAPVVTILSSGAVAESPAPLPPEVGTGQHPCPTPAVGAGHGKPPKGWQEGAVFACECGQLHALRNRWNYAGDWWEWERVSPSIGAGPQPIVHSRGCSWETTPCCDCGADPDRRAMQ